MANGNGSNGNRQKIMERVGQIGEKTRESQAWTSIFRPGSVFRKGYTDSPRNRSYVIMNNVLYHLHPVKVKRHAVKVSYTLCLGGLSFFLFILLTVTGIFLMFFYRPTRGAWNAIQKLETAVTAGPRSICPVGGSPEVSRLLHRSRLYHGAYKAPRGSTGIGVSCSRSPCYCVHGLPAPLGSVAPGVTVGTKMMGHTSVRIA